MFILSLEIEGVSVTVIAVQVCAKFDGKKIKIN